MLRRYSSRRASLYEDFLRPRLAGAERYDRIAGYFQSSLLELASESLAHIPRIRIVCNTEVNPDDVQAVRMAAGGRRRELEEGLLRLAWNQGRFTHLVDVHGEPAQQRLRVLHDLLTASGRDGRHFEIRLVPDSEFGFVHGKGGVIAGDWGATSFIGSANDSARAWSRNYELIWEDDDRPILCSHGMALAFELAESFAKALHKRVKAGGFIKTLLQRRVGSSLAAGIKTAEKMLAGRPPGAEEDPDDEGASLYPLQEHELEMLQRLRDHLVDHLEREADPKFERVRDVLGMDFEGRTWLERGVLIFTQFSDSAQALAEYLQEHFDTPVGLYAGGAASKLYESGRVQSVHRELLKEKVTQGRLHLLIGTDAASTGLNLQRLGSLINLDLPWNPVVLEQRKGRVQRGTLARRIPYTNMRYDKGAEQRLFETLSGRIQEITAIFGTVPDFIVDRWVTDMLEDRPWDDQTVLTLIAERDNNPFTLKETTQSLDADWDATAEVLNQLETYQTMLTSW